MGAHSHGYTFDLGNGLQDITRQELGSWGWTAGGLLSTMNDMAVCAEAFSDGRLLSDDMNREFTNWIPIPVAPGAPQESYTGLGIVKYRIFVGNSGGTYGYTSWMWHIPSKNGVLIAFFNQTSTFTQSRGVNEQTLLAELLNTIMAVVEG
jgi:D-alanyl-D-alanine carboxypeptidase